MTSCANVPSAGFVFGSVFGLHLALCDKSCSSVSPVVSYPGFILANIAHVCIFPGCFERNKRFHIYPLRDHESCDSRHAVNKYTVCKDSYMYGFPK